MANNTYRVSDHILLKTSETYIIKKFLKVWGQYIYDGSETNQDLHSAVWHNGDFAKRINRVFDNILFEPTPTTPFIETNSTQVDLYLKQGFNFGGLFGIHFIAKDMTTEEILISKMLYQNDFVVSDSKELINGSFWIQKISFDIPRTNNNICVQATLLEYSDVEMGEDKLGYIYKYPNEFIPLIGEKPTPDFIKTKIEFDENHWITITPYTTENKTLKQSILDYFGLEVADVQVSHVIKYGNVDLWYKTIRISNEDNTFNPVNLGINLSEFLTEQVINPEMNIVTLFVSTEISVDSKLMKRETSISTDLYATLNPVVRSLIKNPDTVFPVDVEIKTIVENTIIEQNVHTRIVPINQPVYVQFITEDLKFQKSHITFKSLDEDCLLIFAKSKKDEQQMIVSQKSVDGVMFFDLGSINITEPTTYTIQTLFGNRVIGGGLVTL